MILFSNAFALSELAADRPLKNARIGYQNWLSDLTASAVTVSSEDDEGPRDAPLRPNTYEFWEPTSLPATWVVNLGASRDFDYVGIAGHTIGSSGCAVKVEHGTGSFGGSPLEEQWTQFGQEVSPGNDSPLLWLGSSQVASKIRITLSGGSTMPRMAVVYVGEILAMQRSIYGGHSPMNLARDTELHRSLSRGGQFLGQGFRRHGMVGAASFRYLEPDWYRENFDPFVEHARSLPFFFAWRPEDYPLEVAYAWCPEDIKPSNMGVRDFMQVAFNMHGVGHE